MKSLVEKSLLRFTTAGSVDDGKSTLIGRLLYDSNNVFEDQLKAIDTHGRKLENNQLDLSLLTDGLKDEREQGITIDVAYRYFATNRRKFIIADTPGHIEYTRNMITGASTANLALILIDARKGLLEQTKRHSFIASLLQIKHIVVCINKMDLVDYRENVYEQIVSDYEDFASKLNAEDVRFIPISALNGDNVVNRENNMPWYKGSTLLHTLETIHISSDRNLIDCRFPVQTVIRPKTNEYHDYRGFAGKVESGIFKVGDLISVLPRNINTTIKEIHCGQEAVQEAYPPMNVSIQLHDDIDISRGDMLVRPNNQATISQEIDCMMCWLGEEPFNSAKKYTILHTTNQARCVVKEVQYKVDINTLHRIEEDKNIHRNDIARVRISTSKPLFVDSYSKNKHTGSLILIDEGTKNTVAAAMIN